jgi:serine acetyltransferase
VRTRTATGRTPLRRPACGIFLGPGAEVIGRVHIGADVAVGANAVVTTDVPGGSVVAGVPARVISHAGAVGYINHTDLPSAGDGPGIASQRLDCLFG